MENNERKARSGDRNQLPQCSGLGHQQSNDSITILLETRENRGLSPETNSDRTFPDSQTSLSQAPMKSELSLAATSSRSLSTTDTAGSTSSVSARLTTTESQSSGYTTESSYQTALAVSDFTLGDSFYSPPNLMGHLEEIHVRVPFNATVAQIQKISADLRNLLSNELTLIQEASDGNRQAIYIIAYRYM
ncbi:GH22501 [Drosophila grimshawi]|uniref:GH22501 n=2 Tax=Drosophila grimshawi TaxID=7222 RepID=B4K2B1_DROGR|nr:GH22501 [Drosophila grimshawi]